MLSLVLLLHFAFSSRFRVTSTNLIAVAVVDGYTYIIADGYLYRRNNAEGHVDMKYRRKVSSMWKGAPAKFELPRASTSSKVRCTTVVLLTSDSSVIRSADFVLTGSTHDLKSVRVLPAIRPHSSGALKQRSDLTLSSSTGKNIFVVSGLHGKLDAKRVPARRVTVKDPKYPASPSAAFIKFDDRESGNVHLVKVSP